MPIVEEMMKQFGQFGQRSQSSMSSKHKLMHKSMKQLKNMKESDWFHAFNTQPQREEYNDPIYTPCECNVSSTKEMDEMFRKTNSIIIQS